VSLRNHVIFFRMLHSFINRLDFASVASLRVGSSTNRTTKALHRTGRGAVAHDSVVPSARGSSAKTVQSVDRKQVGHLRYTDFAHEKETHCACTFQRPHTHNHSALARHSATVHPDAASAFRCRFNRRRIFGSNAAGRSPNVFVTINS
jgi:hypothetical protein